MGRKLNKAYELQELSPSFRPFDAPDVTTDAYGAFDVDCFGTADMLKYGYRQSPSVVNWVRAARLLWNGPGCRQARCLATSYRFKTSSRVPSDCIYFRFRCNLSHISRPKRVQLGRTDTTKTRISLCIRQAPPFESTARIGLCRLDPIIANNCSLLSNRGALA